MHIHRTTAILILLCASSAHAAVTQPEAAMRRGEALTKLDAAVSLHTTVSNLLASCREMNERLRPIDPQFAAIMDSRLAAAGLYMVLGIDRINAGLALLAEGDTAMESSNWELAFDKFTVAANRGTHALIWLGYAFDIAVPAWEYLIGRVGPPIGGGVGPGGIF